ncbi:MAG: hypothetical protein N2047_04125 [Meiothermus sp.]|nr:hypothetical protein [Meiothermus sp.]
MEMRFTLEDGTVCVVANWFRGQRVRVVRDGTIRYYEEVWDAPTEVVDAFEQMVKELEYDASE